MQSCFHGLQSCFHGMEALFLRTVRELWRAMRFRMLAPLLPKLARDDYKVGTAS